VPYATHKGVPYATYKGVPYATFNIRRAPL
jgi:hypothetical protein